MGNNTKIKLVQHQQSQSGDYIITSVEKLSLRAGMF